MDITTAAAASCRKRPTQAPGESKDQHTQPSKSPADADHRSIPVAPDATAPREKPCPSCSVSVPFNDDLRVACNSCQHSFCWSCTKPVASDERDLYYQLQHWLWYGCVRKESTDTCWEYAVDITFYIILLSVSLVCGVAVTLGTCGFGFGKLRRVRDGFADVVEITAGYIMVSTVVFALAVAMLLLILLAMCALAVPAMLVLCVIGVVTMPVWEICFACR